MNEVEAKAITGVADVEGQLVYFERNYPKLSVILTLGKKGSVMLKSNKVLRQEAYKVNAVDTTAAGDTFTGYFVSGIASGIDEKRALMLASTASAISVSRKGAAPSIPIMEEVLQMVGTLEPNKTENKLDSFTSRLEEYVDGNLKSANIKDLANIFGYSSIYMGSLIKKTLGKTFTAYLQERRCSVAAKLLVNTDMSVGEIISHVGYENESFFRKKFSEYYGANPFEYRKKRG